MAKRRTKADSKASKQLHDKPRSRPKKEKITPYKNELDRVFSRYIRAKYADANGEVKCFTCDKRMRTVGDAQAGHFAVRQRNATRWLEDNVRPQCGSCNGPNAGEQWEFGRRIDQQQPGRAAEIMAQSKTACRNQIPELKAAIAHYTAELEHYQRTKRLDWTRTPREGRGVKSKA